MSTGNASQELSIVLRLQIGYCDPSIPVYIFLNGFVPTVQSGGVTEPSPFPQRNTTGQLASYSEMFPLPGPGTYPIQLTAANEPGGGSRIGQSDTGFITFGTEGLARISSASALRTLVEAVLSL